MGRLTNNADLRYLNGGNAVCRISVAVDKGLSREKKAEFEAEGKATVDFINCVAYGHTANSIAKYTAKGCRVLINGRIQTNSWTNQEGQRQYSTDILINNIQYIDFKSSEVEYKEPPKLEADFPDFVPTEDADERIPF